MFSASLTPQITTLTRLTVRSKSLIDNMFTNSVEENSISGNLECCISQFLIFRSQQVLEENNHRKYKGNYKNLDAKKFKDELQSIDWTTALANNNNNDVNQSLEYFLNTTNSILDRYAPLKQVLVNHLKQISSKKRSTEPRI